MDNYRRVLEIAGQIAGEVVAPNAEQVDREGNTLNPDGTVTLHPLVEENLKRLSQADLMGFTLPRKYGGLNCPSLVYTMATEMVSRADASLMNLFGLQGIAETIYAFADDELKDDVLPRFAYGKVTGAMVLTEPDAGSDLQAVRLRAHQDEEGHWKVDGTATEGALVTLAHKGGLAEFSPGRVDAIPFESEHKYMATLNDVDGERIVFLKGAPERVLDRCDEELTADGPRGIDRDAWRERIDEVAGRGERVIALALRHEDEGRSGIDHDDVTGSFVFLGMTGIYDPPRDEVLDAIDECKEAGIRVIMITGDHAVTANAIARELGIGDGGEALTGAELSDMDDDELREAVRDHSVFARTNPEHKLRLVEALQAQKMLCGMTGDGVNDAPALKRADIGIAMGIKGTEVTKEASEMVLTDDNFATIVHAVEEGRTIYDNIRKTILFLLPANGAEASVIIVAILLGMTLPISPVQVLWVNMVSAVTLALGLTVEPMERKVMQRSPRHPDEPILGRSFFRRIVFVSILSGGLTFGAFLIMDGQGADDGTLALARTVAVNMLVVAHTFYLFACRKLYESSISRRIFDNRLSFLLVGALILLQAAFTYLPFMNTLFGTAPIPLHIWPLLVGAGIGAFLIVELEKLISRRIAGE